MLAAKLTGCLLSLYTRQLLFTGRLDGCKQRNQFLVDNLFRVSALNANQISPILIFFKIELPLAFFTLAAPNNV
jgi:hypothetical protein